MIDLRGCYNIRVRNTKYAADGQLMVNDAIYIEEASVDDQLLGSNTMMEKDCRRHCYIIFYLCLHLPRSRQKL